MIEQGVFPKIQFGSNIIHEVFSTYFEELNSGNVYFVSYRVWRKSEYGLLCDGRYINFRSGVVETYEDFCTRIFMNKQGKLSMDYGKNTKEEFEEMYNKYVN